MMTSVLETSFVEQSGYAKTAQFIYDLLTAKGLARDKYIEFTTSKHKIIISIFSRGGQSEEATFFIYHTQVEIGITPACACPKIIAEIQELAQEFANFTVFEEE